MAKNMVKRKQSSEGTNYENSNSCVGCDRPDSVDDFVCCDKCNGWWHFSCAGVSSSVENRDWVCARCHPSPKKSVSVASTSTTRKARIELQLKQLAEQRELDRKVLELELEKKYVAEKYQLLEQSLLDEEDDRRSVRTRSSKQEAAKEALEREKQVAEWVKNSQVAKEVTDSAPMVIPTKSQNAILDVARIDEDEGAVGGKSVPPGAHLTGSRKVDSSGELKNPANNDALQELQKQLHECQLRPQPSLKQLSELNELVESCKLQITTSKPPADGPNGNKQVPGVAAAQNTLSVENLLPTFVKESAIELLGQQQSGSQAKYSAPRLQKDTLLDRRDNHAFEQMVNRATGKQQNLAPEAASLKQPNGSFRERLSRITNQLDEEIAALRPSDPMTFCAPKEVRSYKETFPEFRFPHHYRTREVPRPEDVPLAAPSVPRVETARQPLEICFQAPDVETVRRAPSPARLPALAAQQVRELTAQQLAARQALPRELPSFAGNPADWPVFISNYKYSTAACGYSDGENMIRLQRCLKGAAWEAVRSRLILPNAIPQVIEALRMRYGRAELLLESLIDKAKSAPSPRSDRLETLIEFGMMVQALCDHIRAADLQDHLKNPTLLKDLVNKLPATYRMQWAGYRRLQDIVNLSTFGDFMEEIVRDACSVSSMQIHESTTKSDPFKTRDRHLMHCETGGSDDATDEHNSITQPDEVTRSVKCAVCQREGHRARDCRAFQDLSVTDRWRKLQELQLCRTCLFGHGHRACRSNQRCEVDGCQARHHRLLHSSTKQNDGNGSEVNEFVQHHVSKSIAPSIFFRIIPVTLHNDERSVQTFAFLDEGSSLTMIQKSLATELGVTGYAKPLCLGWTSGKTHEEQDSLRVMFEVSGNEGERYKMKDVATMKVLDLPKQSVSIEALAESHRHLQGLPIKGYYNAVPQLLIGVDNLRLIIPLEIREGAEGGPTATKTRLGWSVYGAQRLAGCDARSYHISEDGDREISAVQDTKRNDWKWETVVGSLRKVVLNLPLLDVAIGDETQGKARFHRGENVATAAVKLAARSCELIRTATTDTDLANACRREQQSVKRTEP